MRSETTHDSHAGRHQLRNVRWRWERTQGSHSSRHIFRWPILDPIYPYISLYIPIYPYIISLYIIIISQCIPKLRTRSLKTIEVRHSYAVVVRLGALQLHSAADQLRWLRWPQWYQSTQGTSQQLGGIGSLFLLELVTRIVWSHVWIQYIRISANDMLNMIYNLEYYVYMIRTYFWFVFICAVFWSSFFRLSQKGFTACVGADVDCIK